VTTVSKYRFNVVWYTRVPKSECLGTVRVQAGKIQLTELEHTEDYSESDSLSMRSMRVSQPSAMSSTLTTT
jgi:hypothetical protein